MSDDIATVPMAAQTESSTAQAESVETSEAPSTPMPKEATDTASVQVTASAPTLNTGSLPKVSTGSLPKASKTPRTKHSLNALGSDEARALAAKRRAFEEKKQKERDAAKYLADQEREAELDSVLKAAQAKSDAFNAALKQATATNARIEGTNAKRRGLRNRLWISAAVMAALAVAAFIVNIVMGG